MLVPIPWQPALLVHRDLLAKLEAIRARVGRPPMLYGPNSAWRSHAQQKALYDAYLAGTGNPASNPDTGNRTHMRGVAADLQDTSRQMQAACVAVGLQRDPAEAWHWQLPNWANYPIISTLPDPDTLELDVRLIRREGNTPEWSLFHPTLKGPSDLERGYIVTTDPTVARGWARTWSDGFGTEKAEPRDVYVEMQAAARLTYTGDPTALSLDAIAKAVNDDTARRLAS